MQDQQDSDVLPWALAAVAILIMVAAVHVNSGEPSTPTPAMHHSVTQEAARAPAGV